MIIAPTKGEYVILYLIDLYNTSKIWLLERWDVMSQVNSNLPEGKIKNKWWVETREWDTPTLEEKIQKYFRNTAKKYQDYD